MVTRMLGRALQDPEAEVRIAVLGSLAQLRADSYLRAVLLLLRDPEQDVRAAAAVAATELALDENTEILQAELLPLLDDPSANVERAALSVLEARLGTGEIGREVAEKVLVLLTREDPGVATLAAVLAGRCDGPEFGKRLAEVLNNRRRPLQVRRQAALALGERGPAGVSALDALSLAILDPEQPVRLGALTAL